jgi:predicted nucleotidyltransferase
MFNKKRIMENIKHILEQIELTYKVKILYACETGSRAWGFPSPDSDYDIRFIYMHERDWYLALNNQKDTIEFMDGDLDVAGWDLRKSLQLLKKSNVPLIERFQSPVLYYADNEFKARFIELIHAYYSPMASFYHHYSLAKKFGEELKDKEAIKFKSYFYLIRSLLSCNWIVNNNSVLPMHVEGLLTYIDDNSKELIRKLIILKATVGETYLRSLDASMLVLIKNLLHIIELSKENIGINNKDYTLLNDFFIKTLNGSIDN